MDKNKAAYRAKLNAQRKTKRIDSPLVRYNEQDQPVCIVCDVILKSESQWPAHEVSRKHKEAFNSYKAAAASKEQAKRKAEREQEFKSKKIETSGGLAKARASSNIPSNFSDNSDSKKQKIERNVVDPIEIQPKTVTVSEPKQAKGVLPAGFYDDKSVSESRQAQGVLPAGFFDDKSADMLARGIVPVKPDIKDEYKEFEKSIQPDLQEVDSRMEEEEFDAAEMIEEAETVEQRAYRERVEMMRKKRLELKAARNAGNGKTTQVATTANVESSSDDDSNDDDDVKVDWRAKHF